jgi:glycosyltransferase involved in cell wall biosynthesis
MVTSFETVNGDNIYNIDAFYNPNYTKDLISLIVPIYNTEQYLHKCIDSILSQTYSKFELILINDCSNDTSLQICEEYGVIDKRIKIINLTENVGGAEATMRGYNIAVGEYIHFLDSDDWFDDDLLEKAINKIREVKTPIIVNMNTKIESNIKHCMDYIDKAIKESFYEIKDLANFFLVPQWKSIALHSYLDTCKPFFVNFLGYDMYFANVVIRPLMKVYLYNGGCYHYLIREASLTFLKNIYNIKDDYSLIRIIEYTYNCYKSRNLLDKCKLSYIIHVEYELGIHLYKEEYYKQARDLFLKMSLDVLTRTDLYNNNEICFFRGICDCKDYTSWNLNRHSFKKSVKLFNFIPILKIKAKTDKKHRTVLIYLLFGFIPLLKIR